MPLLISRTARLLRRWRPSPRRSPVDAAVGVAHDPAVAERVGAPRAVSMVTARPAPAWSSTRPRSVSRLSSGVSPDVTTTTRAVVPAPAPSASSATRTACPVPVLGLLHRQQRVRDELLGCAGRPARAVARRRRPGAPARRARTAARTWPIMLRPPTGCSTFIGLGLHPGAAAGGEDDHGCGSDVRGRLGHVLSGWSGARALAPRVGVEPTSLSPHSKCGGPCRQTNRGSVPGSRRGTAYVRARAAVRRRPQLLETYGSVGYGRVGARPAT